MKKRILVVDDEINICELLKMELEFEGYEVLTCTDGAEAIKMFDENNVDLVLLDIMLPSINGFDVCRQISQKSDVPVLMLTAKTDIIDKVLGLELGADDYITKPFDMRELLARIKVLIRRTGMSEKMKSKENNENIIKNGEIEINLISRSATVAGREIHLTPKEFDLLELFMHSVEKVFNREDLFNIIWKEYVNVGESRTVDMHIQRLRKKIEDYSSNKYIETVFGIGYKMRKN
ncbi:MAG: response regulator transcription factor [Eubacteriaceae bacterium]|nr:response regulator transcription factor [Eubacteriaceae bacterium]